MLSESIIYKGIKFTRYPNAKSHTDRNYYRPSAKSRKDGIKRLHQEVYKDNFGSIPKGFVVHHKDHNTSNNSPENLGLLHRKEHYKHHFAEYLSDPTWTKRRFIKTRKKLLGGFDAWKGTDEAKKFFIKHSKENFYTKEPLHFTCKWCGKECTTNHKQGGKYCS